jgi:hypothetical protein
MSGTGSLMIRNLRKASDYNNAVLTQDQLLKIAIANDANIANARQQVRLGVPEPLTTEQSSTAEQLQADTGKQESDALNNLFTIFGNSARDYAKSSDVVGQLSPGELFMMNQNFPGIKQDFTRKFNPKIISATFFLEYLRKYFEVLDQSKGVSEAGNGIFNNKFDILTADVADLRQRMPTRAQIDRLIQIYDARARNAPDVIRQPVLERLNAIMRAVPSDDEYANLENMDSVNRTSAIASIQNRTQALPTRNQFQSAIDTQNPATTEQLVSGISLSQFEDLRDLVSQELGNIRSDISSRPAPRRQGTDFVYLEPATIMKSTKATLLQYVRNINTINPNIFGGRAPPSNIKVGDLRTAILEKDTQISALQPLASAIAMPMSSPSAVAEPISYKDKEGYGSKKYIKLGKGVNSKVSKGIDVEEVPQYKQLGKFVIHYPQLTDKDILNVKYQSLGRIPQFRPTPISDAFKDFLVDLLDTGKANNRVYETIPPEERKLFEKIATGAGIIHKLKIKRTITDDDKADRERFELLRGEYLAGNNSQSVLKELRRLVIKFMNEGKLLRQDAMNFLLELSI